MNIVEPRVELIAHTSLACNGRSPVIENYMSLDPDAGDMQQLVEFAGRSCYESWSKPNPATAKNADYIARTLHGRNHWSIGEHASATFYLTGVSRALLAEITRHRHLSFSVLSQRFVDEEDANIVVPPAVRNAKGINEPYYDEELGGGVVGATENLKVMGGLAIATYAGLVEELQEVEGLSRKQAREAARAVLPNMIETRIVVTGNMRAWHEVIERRTAPDADAEFQQVAGMIRDELKKIAPAIFTD